MRLLPLVGAILVLALSFAAAGCGSDDDESAEQWANDVCVELDTWADGITNTVTGVMSKGLSVTRTDLQAAANQAVAATDRLVDGLHEIGPPDTDSGEQAQDEIQQLADGLQQHAKNARSIVEDAPRTPAGAVAAGQAVLGEVGAAADEAQSTLDALRALGSDLRDGIEAASACTKLRERDFASG